MLHVIWFASFRGHLLVYEFDLKIVWIHFLQAAYCDDGKQSARKYLLDLYRNPSIVPIPDDNTIV